jgi:hypothetical protein
MFNLLEYTLFGCALPECDLTAIMFVHQSLLIVDLHRASCEEPVTTRPRDHVSTWKKREIKIEREHVTGPSVRRRSPLDHVITSLPGKGEKLR